ncbi:nitroreductase family protein [Lacticaseibacillus baoqingensis]|uniref:Nitroreductase family protein n=1 Tax=Lacticaseibacillus baoqingensis TaxID=2486013 RepID=A0ABW4EA50_9LACO|nr:nitroreductase family protein [Lacticaseibacillus baoqingensis]
MESVALHHRSIRRFKPIAVDYQALEAVAQATSSSEFLQSFTMIRITAPTLRAKIAKISGSAVLAQPNGELFIFVIDTSRDIHLTDPASDCHNYTNWNAFLAGAFDATLAAQNVLACAERSGLGGVMLGSILNDPQQMIDLLHLPRYTFPLLGLIVGVPAEDPQRKPRLPQALVVSENTYPAFDAEAMAHYDQAVSDYYANRASGARQESFTSLVQQHLTADQHHRDEIGAILKAQGFNLPQA